MAKVSVVTKSRMILDGEMRDAGYSADISEELYENHKSHFITQAQAQKSKKAKELEGELSEVKASLEAANKTNEALKGENEKLKAKLAELGAK